MSNRYGIGLISFVLATLFILVGCGSKEEDKRAVLKIGISSRNRTALVNILKEWSKRPTKFAFEIVEEPNPETARDRFSKENFDIVLMDNVWIPSMADLLIDMKETNTYKHFASKLEIEKAFLPGMKELGRTPDSRIVALPLLGNISGMIYDQNLATPCWEGEKNLRVPGKERVKDILKMGKCLKDGDAKRKSVPHPIYVRDQSPGEFIDGFWEMLRANGYRDEVANDGTIIVSKSMFDDTLKTMKEMEELSGDEVRKSSKNKRGSHGLMTSLFEEKGQVGMGLGWEAWVLRGKEEFPKSKAAIGFFTVAPEPIMGTWYVGIRKTSKLTEIATYILLNLTTSPTIQIQLALGGNIPTLATMSDEAIQQIRDSGAFWRDNYHALRAGLAASKPLPRTPKWHQFAHEALKMYQNDRSVSLPGLLNLR